MKRILLLLTVGLALFSTAMQAASETTIPAQKESTANKQVEVLYFHGKQRCATCIAIEKNVRETLNSQLTQEIKAGKVTFKTIDISQKANEKLAEKYQVSWSSLVLVGHQAGKENSKNLTTMAFSTARKSPETFRNQLVQEIKNMLK